MWYDQILLLHQHTLPSRQVKTHLDIHQILHTSSPQFRELSFTFPQKPSNIIPFLNLYDFPMPTPIPETIRNFDSLVLDSFLFL
jgi:hypothetical protein